MSKWFSVYKRFPTKRTRVLGYLKDYKYDELGGVAVVYYNGSWNMYNKCTDHYDIELDIDRVTHWMALPSAPEA